MYKHKNIICTGTLVCLAQVGFLIELHCLSAHHFGHQIIDNYLIGTIYNFSGNSVRSLDFFKTLWF